MQDYINRLSSRERSLLNRAPPERQERMVREYQREVDRWHTRSLGDALQELEQFWTVYGYVPGEYRNNCGYHIFADANGQHQGPIHMQPPVNGVWVGLPRMILDADIKPEYQYKYGSWQPAMPAALPPIDAAQQQPSPSQFVPGGPQGPQQQPYVDVAAQFEQNNVVSNITQQPTPPHLVPTGPPQQPYMTVAAQPQQQNFAATIAQQPFASLDTAEEQTHSSPAAFQQPITASPPSPRVILPETLEKCLVRELLISIRELDAEASRKETSGKEASAEETHMASAQGSHPGFAPATFI